MVAESCDSPDGFTLHPEGVAGFDEPFDGDVMEIVAPERLVMRWRAQQLHTVVRITLQSAPGGCHLTMVQRGFLGPQGTLRRRVLQRTYAEMTDARLPAALDRLAADERERENLLRRQAGAAAAGGRQGARRNEARFFRQASAAWAGLLANMSMLRSSGGSGPSTRRRRPPARGIAAPAGEALRESPTAPLARAALRRGRGRRNRHGAPNQRTVAVGASVAILVLLAALAVLVERLIEPGGPGARPTAGAHDPRAVLIPGGPPPATSPTSEAAGPSPLPQASASVKPPSVTLAAAYRTDRQVVGGYEGVVTINNLSTQAVDGWSVRLVLPPLGLVVREVRGAQVEQTEKEVLFSPAAQTRVVPAGQPVQFTFQVQGVGAPIECTINDQPCSGIPE